MTVLPLAVAGAVAASVALLQLPVLPQGAALLPLPCALAAALRARRRGGGALQVALFGLVCLVPGLALQAGQRWQALQLPASCERLPLVLRGEVIGLARRYTARDTAFHRLDLRVQRIVPERCAGPRRVQLYLGEPDAADFRGFLPGEQLLVDTRLRRPRGLVNPAARQGERDILVHGLHAVGAATLRERHGLATGLRSGLDRWRLRLSAWLRARGGSAAGPLLAALGVGDQRFIDDPTWDRLRRFGITHLLVISGMHVSLVAVPGWYLGRLLGRIVGGAGARLLPPALALAFAAAYSLLAGLSLPTQRALLMLALLCVPRILGRSVHLPDLLAAAVLVLLLIDPLAVLGASFWLSVSAVALLSWLLLWRGEGHRFVALLRTQLFLLVAMLPVSLFWFGGGATLGGLLNLVAIPLVSLLVVPGVLLALLLRLAAETAAVVVLEAAALPLELLLWLMNLIDDHLPASGFVSLRPPPALLAVALLGGLLCAVPRLPGRWLLLPALVAPVAVHRLLTPDSAFEVVVFDVGQGTAVLVRRGNAALLYDTGPGPPGGPPVAARAVLPALRAFGLRELALLVISHEDLDHVAGESLVRETLAVASTRRGQGPLPRAPSSDPAREPDDEEAARGDCRGGLRERLGDGVVVTFLGGATAGTSDNNASCVVLIEAFGYRFLLPGDIDTRRERELVAYWGDMLRADVLLAGHHGSGSSTSRLWLRRVDPQWLVVSAGYGNRFGHPAPRVLRAAGERATQVLDTARDGALVFRVDKRGQLQCRRYRHRWAPFWRRGTGERDCGPARGPPRV